MTYSPQDIIARALRLGMQSLVMGTGTGNMYGDLSSDVLQALEAGGFRVVPADHLARLKASYRPQGHDEIAARNDAIIHALSVPASKEG